MKKISLLLIIGLFSFSSFALNLKSARKQNLVKELKTGYIEAVDSKNKKVEALVQSVNTKRKKAYEAIAKKNKLEVNQVAKQAAEKIQKKLKK